MTKTLANLIRLTAAVALIAQASAVPILIDNFTDGTVVLTTTGVSPVSNSSAQTLLSGVIGGSRNTTINKEAGGSSSSATIAIDDAGFLGTNLVVTEFGTGVVGNYTLTYADISSVDFEADGNNAFGLSIATDVAGTMTVTATSGTFGTATTTVAVPANGNAFDEFNLAYTSFTGYSSDIFGDIDSLSFTFNPGTSGDWKLQFLATIPEPSTYALIAAGLGLGVFAIRRRKLAA